MTKMTAQMATRLTLRSFKRENRKVSIDLLKTSIFCSSFWLKVQSSLLYRKMLFIKELKILILILIDIFFKSGKNLSLL